MVSDTYEILEGWEIKVKEEDEIAQGDTIAIFNNETINAEHAGKVRIEGNTVIVSYESREKEEYEIPPTSRLIVTEGQNVEAGEALTEGSLNPHTILRIKGREATELYLLKEIQQVYRTQGQNINDKHFEVIVRKMLNKVQVTRPGDSKYLPQDLVDRLEIRRVNEDLVAKGLHPARYVEVLLGISKASLTTDSFLSAASFQHTIKVLASAAIASARYDMYGLKENVIIGKLIPAGTGFDPKRFVDQEAVAQPGKANIEVKQMEVFGDEEPENLEESEVEEALIDDEEGEIDDFSESDDIINFDDDD